MTNNSAPKIAAPSEKPRTSGKSFDSVLKSRESQELVIGLAGPVGCGLKDVSKNLQKELQSLGYEIVVIRASELMEELVEANPKNLGSLQRLLLPNDQVESPQERITRLQNLGNLLRTTIEPSIGAQLAIKFIANWREEHKDQTTSQEDSAYQDPHEDLHKVATSQKTAFIIDQLKHPQEAHLLIEVYDQIYYQLGVLANDTEKVRRLNKLGIPLAEATQLIERDRKEDDKHGQQLEKTMLFSDYYIAYNSLNLTSLRESINRFLDLTLGKNGITPTNDEVGMYSAYSASLQSACLSRQVGSAICDNSGNVLSVGKNDVPKFGGGLYQQDDGENDFRCVKQTGRCSNTENILKLKDGIAKVISENSDISRPDANLIADKISEETTVGSLIEFSRSIHAEMDAILSLGRDKIGSTKGTIMYTTTFPCHNCARHIIAAGISKVIYIEPYEKSQAISLHGDAITVSDDTVNKVKITPFAGVSPKRFQVFFKAPSDRKDKNGYAITHPIDSLKNKDKSYLATYIQFESKVTEHLNSKLRDHIPHVAEELADK